MRSEFVIVYAKIDQLEAERAQVEEEIRRKQVRLEEIKKDVQSLRRAIETIHEILGPDEGPSSHVSGVQPPLAERSIANTEEDLGDEGLSEELDMILQSDSLAGDPNNVDLRLIEYIIEHADGRFMTAADIARVAYSLKNQLHQPKPAPKTFSVNVRGLLAQMLGEGRVEKDGVFFHALGTGPRQPRMFSNGIVIERDEHQDEPTEDDED